MNKCNDIWNGNDKVKHFCVCLALSVITPVLAIIAAVVKEIYDKQQPLNHFCWKDIVADLVGVLCGGVIHALWVYLCLSYFYNSL